MTNQDTVKYVFKKILSCNFFLDNVFIKYIFADITYQNSISNPIQVIEGLHTIAGPGIKKGN